jgi:hypothetical protein
VQGVGSDIKEISSEVRGVDEKLDQVNRSLSLLPLLVFPRPQTASQGACSEIKCYNGFRRQIHLPIVTLHAEFITAVQLNGFPREVYSTNGNPWVLPVDTWKMCVTLGLCHATVLDHPSSIAGSEKSVLWFALLRHFTCETDVINSVPHIKALREAAYDGVGKTRSSAIWTSGSTRELDEENRYKKKT